MAGWFGYVTIKDPGTTMTMLSSLHSIHDQLVRIDHAMLRTQESVIPRFEATSVRDFITRVSDHIPYEFSATITIDKIEEKEAGVFWTIYFTRDSKTAYTFEIHKSGPYYLASNGVEIRDVQFLLQMLNAWSRGW